MPRKVLIVDDLRINRRILSGMLSGDYEVLEAVGGEEALAALARDHGISAVLLDISMPGMDGFEVLRRVRANELLSSLPVIMITGNEDEQARIKSLSLGANDFVMKPYSSEIIKHCLQNNIAFREAAATVSALKRDRLTGLYNREAFFEKAALAIERAPAGYYVLGCMDIENFKVINDQYGSEMGDRVLKSLANGLLSSCEIKGGICGRLYSDCFVGLYAREASLANAIGPHPIEERIFGDTGLRLTLSVGRYIARDKSLSVSAMYDRAAIAKNLVKGRYDTHVAVYAESMRSHLVYEQSIVNDMNAALAERQFEVWFQPQYNHSTDAMIGAEALVRWRHPTRGLIPPGDFISIFEQNGFVYTLDKYVWDESCKYLKKWRDEGRNPLPVSVNISRYDIMRPDLVEFIAGLLKKYELPMELLRLEITESAFTESAQHIVGIVRELIGRGFTVEIDDFGSGYSSLNTLKDVPAQILKLDMKFLEGGSGAERGGNILESVVRMSKWLGMSVIAEGVETREQADYLRSIGCSYMQGYLFARPMPAREYEEHCRGAGKEERLLTLQTVENLDNNAFWNPRSMDTLIFNSYVGGACIFEYHAGKIELLRATEKFAQQLGMGLTVEEVLRFDWSEHLGSDGAEKLTESIERSIAEKREVTGEFVFLDLPGCPHESYLRSSLRVIASAGDRCLVYCINENISAQRQSEKRESEAARQLQAILKHMNGGVAATVMESGVLRRLFANDRFYQQLGYTKEAYEAQSDGTPNCILPEDRAMVLRRCEAVGATGRPDTVEYRVRRADGAVRWLRSGITLMDYPGEALPVQLAVSYDITEQLEAQQQIGRLSGQLQTIMDNVDLGIIAVTVEDGVARYLFTNNRYYEILGYTKAQFDEEVGSPYLTVAQEDLPRVMEETAKINHTGQSVMLEYSARTRDGGRRSLRAVISVARLSGIESPVQFSIIRDITEELEAERRERSAAEQMLTMVSDMPGGYARMRVNPDGKLLRGYFNDNYCDMRGLTREEILEEGEFDALDAVHPDDLPRVEKTVRKSLRSGETANLKYRLRCGSGAYKWVYVFGRLARDKSGELAANLYYSEIGAQLEREETQRALLDNLPGGAGLYEYRGGKLSVVYLNKSYWNLVGRDATDYVGALPLSAVHPDDMGVVARELDSAIEDGRDMACDMRLKLETGYLAVHLAGHIVRITGGYFIYASFAPIAHDALSYQQLLPLLLSAMMDSTTDLSFAKDTNFRYLTVSRAFARMLGLENAKDAIGRTDYELFERELADKYRRDDEALLAGGDAIVDIVEAIPSRDGAPSYSSTSKYVLRDGSGKLIGLYGVGRDVTKAVEQDSQLRLVNDSIPGGLATYVCTPGDFSSEHIRINYFNDGFCRLFGFTREEYMSRASADPASMVFQADRHIIDEQWLALMRSGTPINCLYRAHVNGGGYKWISHKAVATERGNGVVVINAILQDVTDQRELIEQLRISEEENNLAVMLGGSIVMRYLVKEKTLSISQSVAAAHSLPETIEDVPYEPVRRGLIAPESAEAYIGFFEAIRNGSRAGTVLYQQRYFGTWKWMEAKSTTIFSDEGKPVKAVISLFDVTERLEKETIYRKWQQSLNDRAPDSYTLFRCNLNSNNSYDTREGTLLAYGFDDAGLDFNERTAAYARRYVLENDRDSFVAFVNSDTMLASYYRGKRSDALEYREELPDGGFRWLRLTVDLVEYPNSTEVEAYLMYEDIDEAKKAELQTKELSETDPLTGLLNRGALKAKAEQLLRSSKPETRHAFLMMDIDGFKQVNDVFGHAAGDQTLVDIAANLRAIMRRDDLVARLGGDEFVLFLNDVQDERSAALKAQQICALARKSYSLEVQISASVGIALAPRDGLSFPLLYKKADAALYHVKGSGKDSYAFYNGDMADEHLRPEPDSVDSTGEKRAEKKRRMLIVDDSAIDHELLKNIFRDDYIVEKAGDGGSALTRLRHYGSAISVVLLDLMMPGMSGFKVLEKMRESAELRGVPVIIVSGDESREACLKAIRRGATDFITKPVDVDLLRVRVDSAVSRAENERLRAKNCLLEAQNEERIRYESALEGTGIAFIQYDRLTGRFSYYPSISSYLLGTYDERTLWQILLSDGAADDETVRSMDRLVRSVAEDGAQLSGSGVFRLKTPLRAEHSFRMGVRRPVDEYRAADKLIISLIDLDYGMR